MMRKQMRTWQTQYLRFPPKKLELTVGDTSRAFRSLEYVVEKNDLQKLVSVTGFVANDPDPVDGKIVLPTVVDTTVSWYK